MTLKSLCDQFRYRLLNMKITQHRCSQQLEIIDSQEISKCFKVIADGLSQFHIEAELLIKYYSMVLWNREEINELPVKLEKPPLLVSDEKFKWLTKKITIELGDTIMEYETSMNKLYDKLTDIIRIMESEEWDSD